MKNIAKFSLFLLNFSSTIYGQDVLSDDSKVDQSRLISPCAHKIPNLSERISKLSAMVEGEGEDTDRDADEAAAYGGSDLSLPSPLSASNESTHPSSDELGLPTGSPYPREKPSSLTRTSSDISVWNSSTATLTLPSTLNMGAYGREFNNGSSSHIGTNISTSVPLIPPSLTTALTSTIVGAPETSTCSSSQPSLSLLHLSLRSEDHPELETTAEDLTEICAEPSFNISLSIQTKINNIIESELPNSEKAEQLRKLIIDSSSTAETRMEIIQWLINNSHILSSD